MEPTTEGAKISRKYREMYQFANAHRKPLDDAERIHLIKTILYSPNEAKTIVRGIQAIIEQE